MVFLTAAVSGVSIFANNFAVKGFNPFVFTFLKNAVVVVFLFSLIFLLREFNSIKSISRKQLGQLAAIGFVGGSVPFLLYFYALKMTSAINAGFLHKTLFIWATVFAFVFLKEKVSKRFIAAAILLLAGNSLLSNISSFGFPEALILLATVLWAAENVIAKRVLQQTYGRIVAFGRMFFGSAFILLFLALTNQISPIFELSAMQWQWVLLTSVLLFAYVFTFYTGLRFLPVHKATAILLLGQPITAFLSFAFLGKQIALTEAFGLLLTLAGVFLVAGAGYFLYESKRKHPAIAAERN